MSQTVRLSRYLGPMCQAWVSTGGRITICAHESCKQIAMETIASRYSNGGS